MGIRCRLLIEDRSGSGERAKQVRYPPDVIGQRTSRVQVYPLREQELQMMNLPKLRKDPEQISLKFGELIRAAASLHKVGTTESDTTVEKLVLFREVRVSALNLLARVASPGSIYYRELAEADITDHLALRGILQAAANDYRQGYVADNTLLVSAEVFSDLLVQAEILLENDYMDAAAVIIRAVLEDGLRRLAAARGIAVEPKDGIGRLNDSLYRERAYSLLKQKEITAKAQVGNDAAHGHFDKYTKQDVQSFLSYVERFLSEELR